MTSVALEWENGRGEMDTDAGGDKALQRMKSVFHLNIVNFASLSKIPDFPVAAAEFHTEIEEFLSTRKPSGSRIRKIDRTDG